MWHDATRPQYRFIKQLQPGSFEFEPCHAPVMSMFGWRVFFEFAAYNSLNHDEDVWNN